MIIVADTSALLAAFDPDQDFHEPALEIIESETLYISPLVMTEFDHLVGQRHGFERAASSSRQLIKDFVSGEHQLAQITPEDLVIADEVRSNYAGLQLDLADTIGVALAARYRTNRIFTLDQRDFRAIKPLTPAFDHFEILPIDRP